MDLSVAELAALDAGNVRIGLFFRLATTPVIRLWLGIGKIEPGVNALDLTGATYTGMGELRNVPEFNQLINGQAERVEFTISGVSGDVLALASAEANDVKGKEVALGFGLMDSEWSLIGAVRWSRLFIADFLAIKQEPTDDAIVRTLTLSCASVMTGRRRPGLSYFSDADQQRRYPGDKFFERVPRYAQEIRKPWPRF